MCGQVSSTWFKNCRLPAQQFHNLHFTNNVIAGDILIVRPRCSKPVSTLESLTLDSDMT